MTKDPGFGRAHLLDPTDFLPRAPLYSSSPDDALVGASARYVNSPTGDRLRIASFLPAGDCRGTVLVSVGRSEMIEKYEEVASDLTDRGFAVVIQEWAGQGLSGRYLQDPLRAHMIGGAQRQIDNLDQILVLMDGRAPRPWLTLAHSMGGGLTALALVRGEARFDAAILSAPMIAPRTSPYPQAIVKAIASRRVAQGRGDEVAAGQADPAAAIFERNRLTHDPVRFEASRVYYRQHPELRLGEPTWQWLEFAFEIRDALKRPRGNIEIKCPLLVLTAGDDRYVDNRSIKAFCETVPNSRLISIPNAYHEILLETDGSRSVLWNAFDALAASICDQASNVIV